MPALPERLARILRRRRGQPRARGARLGARQGREAGACKKRGRESVCITHAGWLARILAKASAVA